MKRTTYRRLTRLFAAGKFKKLELELAPFLAESDPDARFLNVHFSTTLSGAEMDARMVSELHKLSAELHPPSLRELAWRYRHGDDVPRDYAKFKDMLATAAILGNEAAKRDLAVVLEIDLGYSRLAMRFPEN
jgi:TPR repeat protein